MDDKDGYWKKKIKGLCTSRMMMTMMMMIYRSMFENFDEQIMDRSYLLFVTECQLV